MNDEKETNIWKNMIRVFEILIKTNKIYVYVTIISTAANSLIPVISMLVMQNIINMIQKGNSGIKKIFIYILIYISIDLLQTAILSGIGYFNTKFNLKINLSLKNKILRKVKELNLKDYENSEIYNIIQRAQNQSEGKLTIFFNMFVNILGTGITMITYLILLLAFRWWIVGIVLIIPIMKYLVIKKINIKQFKIMKERTNTERKAWYYSYIMTNGTYFKELKLYNLFDYFCGKFNAYKKKFINQDLEIAKESMVKVLIFSIVEQIIDGLLFSYIVYIGYIGKILIGNVMTYTKAVMQTKNNVQTILQTLANIQKESLYIDQLYEFLNIDSSNKLDGTLTVPRISEIRIENLSYKYRNSDKYVLKNINLVLRPRELYAIIGRNGSGKTTLAKIIMGFYDDYEGYIYINGIDLKKIDRDNYMSKVGTLFQDFGRYEATFRENISYGNLKIMNADDYIWQISSKFNINELINKSEGKLDTQLGYWFDNGKQISIGQWQKVALARAFAKEADIYILDEPNAALDAISEYNLSNMYNDLLKNKIGIIIAHRFNNFIRQANNIIVLEEGVIVESGTHEELINSNGVYNKLYNIQVGNYQMEQNILS